MRADDVVRRHWGLVPWLMMAAGIATSIPIAGFTPSRLAMNTVAGSTQLVTARLLAGSFGLGPTGISRVTIWSAALSWVPLFGDIGKLPPVTRGTDTSPMLRTIALQYPDQGIRSLLPLPPNPGDRLRVRVTLDRPYHGPARLIASVSGVSIGRMFPMGTTRREPGFELSFEEVEAAFSLSAVGASAPMEVVLRQSEPDPKLRVVVWGSDLGTVYGRDTAWLGSGTDWVRGIPLARTGIPADGVPVVWLQNVD